MKSSIFVKRIRKYAIFSFLIPLIAINACFGIYKYLGNLDVVIFPNFNWSKSEQNYKISLFCDTRPVFPDKKKVPAGIPQGSKARIFLKSSSFGHQTIFLQEKKSLREYPEAPKLLILEPKWVHIAPFELSIFQNLSKLVKLKQT